MINLLQSLGHKYFSRVASIPILSIHIYVRFTQSCDSKRINQCTYTKSKQGMCLTQVLVATRDLVIESNLRINHLIQSQTHIASINGESSIHTS